MQKDKGCPRTCNFHQPRLRVHVAEDTFPHKIPFDSVYFKRNALCYSSAASHRLSPTHFRWFEALNTIVNTIEPAISSKTRDLEISENLLYTINQLHRWAREICARITVS